MAARARLVGERLGHEAGVQTTFVAQIAQVLPGPNGVVGGAHRGGRREGELEEPGAEFAVKCLDLDADLLHAIGEFEGNTAGFGAPGQAVGVLGAAVRGVPLEDPM